MKLSNPEKLILLMLSEIYDKLELTDIDTHLLRSAIYTENTWALDWEMTGVVGSTSEQTPPEVQKVVSCLEMWSILEESHAALSSEDKQRVEAEASPLGRVVRFPGFDGNNESRELSIARILIDSMGRFGRFQGRDLNSHAPLMTSYMRMFEAYSKLGRGLGGQPLSVDQIVTLLKAMRAAS